METFYFGRLNYKSQYELVDLLNHGNQYRPLRSKNIKYGIFSIEVIEDKDLGLVYTGELVKYQDLKEEPVVKDHKLSIEYIADVIQGKSRFFLIEGNHLIAYNPYGKIISPKAFCEAFSGIIIGADDSFNVDSEIYPVNREYEFMSLLRSMKLLRKLEINLTPSNPNRRDDWKEIDERLNEMHVGRYREEMQAMPNASIELDELTERKISMAQDGYGKAKGSGEDADGHDITISTDQTETVMKKHVDSGLPVSGQFFSLKSVFSRIIERFISQ